MSGRRSRPPSLYTKLPPFRGPSHVTIRVTFQPGSKGYSGRCKFSGAGLSCCRRYPGVFERASGAYIYDVDDRRYIDYVQSWGPMILGHGHPEVLASIHRQLDRVLALALPPSWKHSSPSCFAKQCRGSTWYGW